MGIVENIEPSLMETMTILITLVPLDEQLDVSNKFSSFQNM